MPSVDLTTLPGWSALADKTYDITIVAKANGFKDSAPSAAVQVEKAAGYIVTVSTTSISPDIIFYSLDGGNTWIDVYSIMDFTSLKGYINNVKTIKFKVEDDGSHAGSVESTELSFRIYSGYQEGAKYSDNFTLTKNIDDITVWTGAD